MNREQKEQQLEFLTDCFTRSEIAIFADFRGLSVGEMTELRGHLRGADSSGKVIKNRLARLAAASAFKDAPAEDLEKLMGLFEGPNFLAFSYSGAVSPAKALAKFAKDRKKEKKEFDIKGGWFDGKFIDSSKINELSNMASREETLAKLLSLLNAPATKLLQTINAPASQFVQLLSACKGKLEAGGEE